MHRSHVSLLRCPDCGGTLEVSGTAHDDVLLEGELICSLCSHRYPILRGVPRFVPIENYASGFGFEWVKHARTQRDSETGKPLSEERLFRESGWERDLSGEYVLEVGSGAGRFTDHLAATGATVVSFDYSYAVDANYAVNGMRPNVLIVQASVYAMPFPSAFFDRVLCFGMIQHTPNPRETFLSSARMLKSGGYIAADLYEKRWDSFITKPKYWVRPFTRRMDSESLYRLTTAWIDLMWPLASALRRLPLPNLGRRLNWHLLVPDYSDHPLSPAELKQWANLDLFDMLAPRYDYPQSPATVRSWCREGGLEGVEILARQEIVEVRARAPERTAPHAAPTLEAARR